MLSSPFMLRYSSLSFPYIVPRVTPDSEVRERASVIESFRVLLSPRFFLSSEQELGRALTQQETARDPACPPAPLLFSSHPRSFPPPRDCSPLSPDESSKTVIPERPPHPTCAHPYVSRFDVAPPYPRSPFFPFSS